MASWKDVGQNYIYHIKIDNKVYVGQSKAKKPGSRLRYRLRAPFSFKHDQKTGDIIGTGKYDIEELAQAIRKKGLKEIEAQYFLPPYYGVDAKLMESFQKHFKQNSSGDKDVSNLNAAEILHILYFQHNGYKLFNTSMGGTGGSLTVITDNNQIIEKMFTYHMTPKEAHSLFFSSKNTLARLRKLVDYFNKIIFTKEWDRFYSSIVASGKWKKTRKTDEKDKKDTRRLLKFTESQANSPHLKASYGQLIRTIRDNIVAGVSGTDGWTIEKIKPKIKERVKNWITLKKEFFFEYIEEFVEDSEDMKVTSADLNMIEIHGQEIDSLVQYIADGIRYQLVDDRELKKEFRKKSNIKQVKSTNPEWRKFFEESTQKNIYAHNASTLSKKFNVIRISAVFDLKGITHSNQTWWGDFTSWKPFNGSLVDEDLKKQISYSAFTQIYNTMHNSKYYNQLEIVANGTKKYGSNQIVVNKYNDTYAFASTSRAQSLSAKIHQKYNELGITFVNGQWTEFYSRMVSLLINGEDQWQIVYEDYSGREVAYRDEVEVDTPYGPRKIGHVVKNKEFWGTISTSELKIY